MKDFDQILDRINKAITECIGLIAKTNFGLTVAAARRGRKMTQREAGEKVPVPA